MRWYYATQQFLLSLSLFSLTLARSSIESVLSRQSTKLKTTTPTATLEEASKLFETVRGFKLFGPFFLGEEKRRRCVQAGASFPRGAPDEDASSFPFFFFFSTPTKRKYLLFPFSLNLKGHGRSRRRQRGLQDPRRRPQPQGCRGKGPRLGRHSQGRDELAADRGARVGARRGRGGPDAQAQGAPDPGGQRARGADRNRDED